VSEKCDVRADQAIVERALRAQREYLDVAVEEGENTHARSEHTGEEKNGS